MLDHENSRGHDADRVPDVIVVPIDVDRQEVDLAADAGPGDDAIDVIDIDEFAHELELSARDTVLEGRADGAGVIGQPFDPQAGPTLLQQVAAVVFLTHLRAEFDEYAVGCADPTEDFR